MKALFFGLACTAMLASCVNAKPSTPAIWRACDKDNCLYLLGSFHALQPTDYPMSQAVQDAYADAELLAFEVAPDQLLSPDLAREMQQAGLLPASETLQQHLPAKTWRSLLSWIEKNPTVSPDAIQRLKPWYMALIITNTQAHRQGFKPEHGIDQHFMGKASANEKPSIGLEQAQQQISLFDGMNMTTQVELLEESLQPIDRKNNELEQLHALWKAGDVLGMEKITVQKMQREYPELYQSINVDRNKAWAPKLQHLLDQNSSQDVLVIVGALHLIGPDGLVTQMQTKGYKLERL